MLSTLPFAAEDRARPTTVAGRLLRPAEADLGDLPAARDFDLAALACLRDRMVQLDGLCVDPARAQRDFMAIGAGLARFLIDERRDFVLSTVRVGIADGGHTAASMHAAAFSSAPSPEDLRIAPRCGLALERLAVTLQVHAPVLQGWVGLGAWVCGEPAWNRDPHCAEIPVLLALSRLRSASARRFLAAAT